MLQAINRYEPLVAHCAELGPPASGRPVSPVRGGRRRAGHLHLAVETPAETGAYRHDRLRESFEPVIVALRATLSAVLEQTAIPIPIEPRKFGIYVAVVADKTLLRHRRLHPGGARRPAGRGPAAALPGADQDRSGGEDPRPGQPAAAGRAGAAGARGATADSLPRGLRLLRARSDRTNCGGSSRVPAASPSTSPASSRGWRWSSGPSGAGAESRDAGFRRSVQVARRHGPGPRPGAGKRGAGDRPAPAPCRVRPRPFPSRRGRLGLGLNPLVQAASPLLLLAGQLRGTLAGPDVRRCVVTRSTRFAGSRSARALAASRTKSCSPRATRCAQDWTRPSCRRRGARRANGRSSRCSWPCTGRRGAARSSSRCSTGRRRIPSATSI